MHAAPLQQGDLLSNVQHTLLSTVIALVLAAPLPALAAFSCPAVDPAGSADRPDLSAMPLTDADPTVSKSVLGAIDAMRLKGDRSGAIVDRIVAAYCTRIGAGSGSDAAKAEQVRRFAANLASVVYRPVGATEEDIVLDTPVPTGLYDRLVRAAEAAKVSRSAWVRQAIEQHLGTH